MIKPMNFIHTPGYAPLPITTEPYILHLVGKLPDYELHEYFDQSFHLVHKDYVRYTINVMGICSIYEFNKNEALITYKKAMNDYPHAIIELSTTDWIGKVISYTWFKRHTYTPFHKPALPKKNKTKEHPYKQYESQS